MGEDTEKGHDNIVLWFLVFNIPADWSRSSNVLLILTYTSYKFHET